MPTTRRAFLQAGASLLALPTLASTRLTAEEDSPPPPRPKIAALVTEYRGLSHADVILSRIIQGYVLAPLETYPPRTRLVSLYVDQFPPGDLSRAMAVHAQAHIFPSIRDALTLGTNSLAVDGVLLIGEHGNYPFNEKGQHLYPRRRFFEEIVRTFEAVGKAVPVFNDKGLGYSWDDAQWMYEQARRLKFPLMAGSSLPTTYRRPDLELPLGVEFEEALAIGYGGLEAYGFHALETLQCLTERRRGGESGVAAVTCLEGPAVWQAAREGRWSRELLEAVLACVTRKKRGTPEEHCTNPELMLIDYVDGLHAAILMLDGFCSAFGFAGKIRGEPQPVASHFWLQEPGWAHFSYLVHNVESMFLTGKETYPPERTLLTTGILDAVMTSRFEGHRTIDTPWLTKVKYHAPENSGRRAKV